MAAFAVTWTDGHVETIESERYDYDSDGNFLFHDGGAGKPVATVPGAGVRLIRRAREQVSDTVTHVHHVHPGGLNLDLINADNEKR
ncbi:hypothetical protein Q7689_00370 [Nocardiopsis tropica]|uniref:hypothetical protein n=1 Tax=Nocardiopsis tropica TaxID=109330 RepID=UPI002E832E8B|nr:hypothetical protein [Nocardiopsis tropica]